MLYAMLCAGASEQCESEQMYMLLLFFSSRWPVRLVWPPTVAPIPLWPSKTKGNVEKIRDDWVTLLGGDAESYPAKGNRDGFHVCSNSGTAESFFTDEYCVERTRKDEYTYFGKKQCVASENWDWASVSVCVILGQGVCSWEPSAALQLGHRRSCFSPHKRLLSASSI